MAISAMNYYKIDHLKVMMMCNCIEIKTALLRAKKNTPMLQIDTMVSPQGNERVCINGVYKKVMKGARLSKTWYRFQIPAKFCPFCGKPYDP